jgi:hypothetical protein
MTVRENAASSSPIEYNGVSSAVSIQQAQPLSNDLQMRQTQSLAQVAAGSHHAAASDSVMTNGIAPHADMLPAIGYAAADGNMTSTTAVAREIVSPHDLIRAINEGEIAIKHAAAPDQSALSGQVWLFDETDGTFVAPAPEPVKIVLDRGPMPETQSEQALGLVATAVVVSSGESSWLGALREFGRKAARAVQQRTQWME